MWALLGLVLVAALATTWVMTRPDPPLPQWVGAVRVLAGDGRDGWRDGPADVARFSEPFGLAATGDGTVLVSDAGTSHRIRRITPDGAVTTLAGGSRGFSDGRGAAARFATPSAIALAPDGSLVVADTGNHAIRRVQADGTVTTVAGNGQSGYIDGPAAQARFNAPVGVAVDSRGRIVVADTYNDRIRIIGTDGEVTTLAGGDGSGAVDGQGPDARFATPCGVAVDPAGRVLVADTGNGALRAISPDGTVSTLPLPLVGLERPMALATSPVGDIYVVDERGGLVIMPAGGGARWLAGGAPGFADGVASEARFRRPSALVLLAGPDVRAGRRPVQPPRLVVADAGNALVRLVQPVAPGMPGWTAALPAVGDVDRRASRFASVHPWWPWGDVLLPVPPRPLQPPSFDAAAFARTPLLWPVAPLDGPHEVAGTFGEVRGQAGQPRFHAGLDVRDEQGTPVHAVRDGIVASPVATAAFGTLNESVRIGPLAYVHIRVGRMRPGPGPRVSGTGGPGRTGAGDPPGRDDARALDLQRFSPVYDDRGVMVAMRAKRGAFFAAGDVVGTINAFNHVHLNVGWSGEEHNPLRFGLLQFRDGIAPTIAAHGIRLFDEAWQPLNPDRVGPLQGRGRARRPTRLPPLEPVMVRGRVRIVVDAWDQADGNKAYRRLGVYAVGYSVVSPGASGTPEAEARTATSGPAPPGRRDEGVAGATQHFDRMRRDADAARLVYATGSGIPVYGASRTQFLYVATTAYRDGIASEGFWDTTRVAPGAYVLQVFVADFSGNQTTRSLRVVVVP